MSIPFHLMNRSPMCVGTPCRQCGGNGAKDHAICTKGRHMSISTSSLIRKPRKPKEAFWYCLYCERKNDAKAVTCDGCGAPCEREGTP